MTEVEIHPAWKNIPLESNPSLFDNWCWDLGLDSSSGLRWEDVWSLDEDSIDSFPRPVRALILSFKMEKDGKQLQAITDAWHTRQDFYHICGTIALLHVLGNVQAPLKAGSALATFYADTKNDDSASRCSKLRQNEAIATAHTKYASLGDSVIPEPDEVSAHYVALVPLNGRIIDLNGAAKYPMDRGPTAGDFLADAAAYVKSEILPHVIHNELNLLALVGGSS